MCTGTVSPHYVLKALQAGADGIFVAGCRLGECHYQSGNDMASKRMTFLKKLLEFSGIHPERLRTRWVSSAEAVEFVHEISEFVEDIKKLGPNPLRVKAKEAA
jgi:F420-non-reducing hydrogenase iron-sulfur subunit